LLKREIGDDAIKNLVNKTENFYWILIIFTVSELFFGIIPPELFMIWSLGYDSLSVYIQIVVLFSLLSYLAGITGFLFGKTLSSSRLYLFLRNNFIGKYEKYVLKFGGFLIIVAALTPIPFSGISMIIGTVNYPFKKFISWGLFRFIRFGLYATFIWEANLL
jgi:membrane protein DedA with SNARE-associated domain